MVFSKNIILISLLLISAIAQGLEGKIVGVHDGDTVTLLDDNREQHKIRLAQIDAPELGQTWGRNAKEALSELVFDKRVTVEVESVDRYGRQVGSVFVKDSHNKNIDVCREMVSRGDAWVFTRYLHDTSLIDNERLAKTQRRGLWSMKDPVAPWEWRKTEKEAKKAKHD